jgi:hypothetical protein
MFPVFIAVELLLFIKPKCRTNASKFYNWIGARTGMSDHGLFLLKDPERLQLV